MRIPFPERVPIDRVALFAVALFAIQLLEGTAPYFAFGCSAFILISAFAFNTAGGLARTSGVYVFFYSVLVVIVGVCYKAFLGEPGQSNLLQPHTTIEVYVGGSTAMLAAVVALTWIFPQPFIFLLGAKYANMTGLIWLVVLNLALHVAGALKHQFDGHPVLWRMWPGRDRA